MMSFSISRISSSGIWMVMFASLTRKYLVDSVLKKGKAGSATTLEMAVRSGIGSTVTNLPVESTEVHPGKCLCRGLVSPLLNLSAPWKLKNFAWIILPSGPYSVTFFGMLSMALGLIAVGSCLRMLYVSVRKVSRMLAALEILYGRSTETKPPRWRTVTSSLYVNSLVPAVTVSCDEMVSSQVRSTPQERGPDEVAPPTEPVASCTGSPNALSTGLLVEWAAMV
mmetsp:Transcript_32188/g.55025  ORF Transcript_32188/g.55025 Transcript_32188/m.55025 type:complete len:224 (-) Transcript_32188:27-698(-)